PSLQASGRSGPPGPLTVDADRPTPDDGGPPGRAGRSIGMSGNGRSQESRRGQSPESVRIWHFVRRCSTQAYHDRVRRTIRTPARPGCRPAPLPDARSTPMPTTPTARLAELGISLPPAPAAVASYVPVRITGDQAFVSGQLPFGPDRKLARTGP